MLKAGVAALAGALLVGCSGEKSSGGKNTPEGAATAFMTAVYKGDVDAALSNVYFPEQYNPESAIVILTLGRGNYARAAEAAGGLKSLDVVDKKEQCVDTDTIGHDGWEIRVALKDPSLCKEQDKRVIVTVKPAFNNPSTLNVSGLSHRVITFNPQGRWGVHGSQQFHGNFIREW